MKSKKKNGKAIYQPAGKPENTVHGDVIFMSVV